MAIYTEFAQSMFIHIPKCAGESISAWLVKHANGKKNLGKHSLMSEHPKIPKDTYVFTCVRHPYSWVYSGWAYMTKKWEFRNMTLDDWIFGDEIMMTHICGIPQHEYIDFNRINYIMKHENLSNDFARIQKILKNNSILENRNKSPRRADAVLSNDMKEKIYETFHTDFELLGYKK